MLLERGAYGFEGRTAVKPYGFSASAECVCLYLDMSRICVPRFYSSNFSRASRCWCTPKDVWLPPLVVYAANLSFSSVQR